MASAPLFDKISFSSKAAPGSSRAFEPVAMMTCLVSSDSGEAPVTLIA